MHYNMHYTIDNEKVIIKYKTIPGIPGAIINHINIVCMRRRLPRNHPIRVSNDLGRRTIKKETNRPTNEDSLPV